MGDVTAFRYCDRSADERERLTLAQLPSRDLEEIARYIVSLEMRLEALGHREHFEQLTGA